jgi:NAD(P)-dependent dehydrogenase (short-subunit alcohol dehydrogenase family)
MQQTGFSIDLFKGKTVVITGAGRGIGFSVASAFAGLGARVIVHSGRKGTAANFANTAVEAIEADFLKRAEINSFIDEVASRTRTIDVLINNAGTMQGRFPAGDLTDQQYDDVVMLNQTAVVMVCRGLLPKASRRGKRSHHQYGFDIRQNRRQPGFIDLQLDKGFCLNLHQGPGPRTRSGRHSRQCDFSWHDRYRVS